MHDLLVFREQLARMRMKAQCHIERRGKVGVSDLGQLALGRRHLRLPTHVDRPPSAGLRIWPNELEEQEPVIWEDGLGLHLLRLVAQGLRCRGEKLCLAWHLGGWRPPSQQEQSVLVPEVRDPPFVHAVVFRRGLEQPVLHRVQHDVPQSHHRANHRRDPRAPAQGLPLLSREGLVGVAPHHQEWVKKIHQQVAPTLEPHRGEEGRKEESQGPQVPRVEVREADHERHGSGHVQRDASDELAYVRRQRSVADLGW
mmetsp:Transcript_99936/g.214015  ORF Transcript_99936/g.214015 Transcript_99936/m.214015 type:complete len:255 (-) Transcript_99936:921-1685(-)